MATGQPLLEGHDLPAEAAALLALEVGRAHLVLGHEREASRLLEQGLAGAPSDPASGLDLRPYRYWAGMAALVIGDLRRACEHLRTAARSDGADLHPYQAAAMRGLAQVEAERGQPGTALVLLDELMERGDLSDMGLAVRCVMLQRLGRDDGARFHLHGPLGEPEQLDDLDRGQRATLGTVAVIGGEVMVKLGHPDGVEAGRARGGGTRRHRRHPGGADGPSPSGGGGTEAVTGPVPPMPLPSACEVGARLFPAEG